MKKALALMLTALLLCGTLAACNNTPNESGSALPAAGEGTIKIATKPMVEQLILGEMLGLIIEQETGYQVEITKSIGGGTSNIQPAMVKGEFDLYPEYTGTGWYNVLGQTNVLDDEEMFAELQTEYEQQFDFSWVGLYGYKNNYAIAVRNEIAQQYNLESCSDLAEVASELTFGGNGDYFEREDGFDEFCRVYDCTFNKTVDIDMGLKYTALENGEIDVANGNTTDAQLSVADVKVLEDDKHYSKSYNASTVVRNDALARFKGLREALMLMDGLLSDEDMARLNYQVEVEEKDEKQVAQDFLAEKGLLK